jgi:hypothetical protein
MFGWHFFLALKKEPGFGFKVVATVTFYFGENPGRQVSKIKGNLIDMSEGVSLIRQRISLWREWGCQE